VTITPILPAPPPPQIAPELEEALAAARRLTAGIKVPADFIARTGSLPAGSRSANGGSRSLDEVDSFVELIRIDHSKP
jgi:hypothetical protein